MARSGRQRQHPPTSASSSSLSSASSSSSTSQPSSIIGYRLSRASYLSSHERPPSNVKEKQGDHVSAYRLIKGMVLASLENRPLDDGFKSIFHLLNLLYEHIDAQIKKLSSADQKTPDFKHSEEIDEYRAKASKVLESIEKAKNDFDVLLASNDIINPVKQEALNRLFNLGEKDDEYKEFLSHHSLDIHELRESVLINAYYSIEKKLEKIVEQVADSYILLRNKLPNVAFLQEENLSPPPGEGARVRSAVKYLDDAHNKIIHTLPSKKKQRSVAEVIATQLFNLFWYPKIPSSNKKSKGRSNDLERLYNVAAIHMDIIFICYPGFMKNDSFKNLIVQLFIEQVANRGVIHYAEKGNYVSEPIHWGMNDSQTKEFYKNVSALLNSPFAMSYQSPPTSTSSSPASSGSKESDQSIPSELSLNKMKENLRALLDKEISSSQDESDPDYEEPSPSVGEVKKMKYNSNSSGPTSQSRDALFSRKRRADQIESDSSSTILSSFKKNQPSLYNFRSNSSKDNKIHSDNSDALFRKKPGRGNT